jgi:type VI secretion system protein ImpF
MSRIDSHQGLMPSMLDRLIDPDSAGTVARRGYGVAQMTEAVRRDLTELLNTRQSHHGLPPGFDELHRSILAYGLPDLTSMSAVTPEERRQIAHTIERVIELFEPRLRDVHATVLNPTETLDRTIRFRLDGRLCLDPAPEVAFDTVLELSTGRYAVQPSSGVAS